MTPNTLLHKDFEHECRVAFNDLRAALIELYASAGADPGSPQDIARRFGVNKTLTWNISKVVSSTDPLATLPNVPGSAALRSLLVAMQQDGAAAEAADRVQRAASTLEQVVEMHVGDRGTLELIIDGMGRNRGDHLEVSRKLAFRGNSGLWGVQSKTRLMTVFLAPNVDAPDMMDIAIARGYIGFRRLRSDVRWPIFQLRGWGEEGGPMTSPWQPLEEWDDRPNGLPLMRRFSTVDASAIEEVRTTRGIDYVLAPGPIGNSGAVDCFVSDCERAAVGKYRTDVDTTGEFGATISAPTERLIFDLLAEESLDFALTPEVRAFSGIFMERSEDTTPADLVPIPVPQNVTALPGRPPVVANPNVPRYSEIVSFVQQRMRWKPEQFRGCRFELTYPPMGSTVLLRFKLPSRPGGGVDL